MRSLEEVAASLERFSGVNRKALDQYVDSSNYRDELGNRLQEKVGRVAAGASCMLTTRRVGLWMLLKGDGRGTYDGSIQMTNTHGT